MLESRCRAGHQTLFPERVPVRALLSGLVLAVAAVVGLAVLSGTADAGLPGSSGFAATSLHVGPEAENDAFIGVVGDELSFDICVNDTEGHGDTVLSREFGGYAAGLERSGCVISGIASVCGTRLYRYRATDATGTFATATVAITIIGCEGFPPAWVTPTPVPPTAVPATATAVPPFRRLRCRRRPFRRLRFRRQRLRFHRRPFRRRRFHRLRCLRRRLRFRPRRRRHPRCCVTAASSPSIFDSEKHQQTTTTSSAVPKVPTRSTVSAATTRSARSVVTTSSWVVPATTSSAVATATMQSTLVTATTSCTVARATISSRVASVSTTSSATRVTTPAPTPAALAGSGAVDPVNSRDEPGRVAAPRFEGRSSERACPACIMFGAH